jgi:hypothetical protein
VVPEAALHGSQRGLILAAWMELPEHNPDLAQLCWRRTEAALATPGDEAQVLADPQSEHFEAGVRHDDLARVARLPRRATGQS